MGIYKKIYTAQEARTKLLEGVNIVADAVKITLGAKGRNVAIKQFHGPTRITKDGVSIARSIQLKDEASNMGANLISWNAMFTAEGAGDGTTTSTVLAQAIANAGMKYVISGMNPIQIKKGIDLAVHTVINYLDSIKTPVKGYDQIKQVATVSANGDTEMGGKVAEAVEKMGVDGAIIIEESKVSKSELELEIIEGIQFKAGFSNPFFINVPERASCELQNPHIIVIDNDLMDMKDTMEGLQAMAPTGRPIFIICRDIMDNIEEVLIHSKMKAGLKVCVVKVVEGSDVPLVSNLLQDIAARTGTEVISRANQVSLAKQMKQPDGIEFFGTCSKIIVTKDKTRIIGGEANVNAMQDRIKIYEDQLKKAEFSNLKEEAKICLGRLRSGIAVLRAGGNTEVEMKERRDRMEDAMYSSLAAVEDGVVPGGGVALFNASLLVSKLTNKNRDINAGIRILEEALRAPLYQICKNAGLNAEEIAAYLKLKNKVSLGFDVVHEKYIDMLQRGIVDAAKVTKRALNDAASIAGLILTTETIIFDDEEEKKN